MRFKDRADAGERLKMVLEKFKGEEVVIYAMPRGGVPLGAIIAKSLAAPLDLVIVRKVGHPFFPEYAVCAVNEAGEKFCNEAEIKSIDRKKLESLVAAEVVEARRRRETYLKGRERISPEGKTAIIVDDGVSTGLTMRLALKEIRRGKPKRLIAVAPIVPMEAAELIKKEADELITLEIPEFYLGAVGAYYGEFPQLDDEEVSEIIASSPLKKTS